MSDNPKPTSSSADSSSADASSAEVQPAWNFREIKFSLPPPNYNEGVEEKWERAIRQIMDGKPRKWGGKIHDIVLDSKVFDEYTSQTPPQVTQNTTIVALCGLTHDEAMLPQNQWLFADFLAFWHLFQGETSHQFWLHAIDMHGLLSSWKNIVHGSPFKTRKVVLDDTIYTEMLTSKHCPTPVTNHSPKAFREVVMREQKKCAQEDRNLLILLFAHGHASTKAIWVGGQLLRMTSIETALKTEKNTMNPRVAILSAACYSGAWSCYKALGSLTSTVTAAGPNVPALSWPYSGSLKKRAGGGYFASAIIDALSMDISTGARIIDTIGEEEMTDEQEETYAAWTHTAYKRWLSIDRHGWAHEFKFSAQNDLWGSGWRERTGIPTVDYHKKWSSLPNWPVSGNQHPGDDVNHDPTISRELRDEYAQLKKLATDAGLLSEQIAAVDNTASTLARLESFQALGSLAQSSLMLAPEYLTSNPGPDEMACNGFQVILRDMLDGCTPYEEEYLASCYPILNYRIKVMAKVDDHVQFLELPLPDGKSCAEWWFNSKPEARPEAYKYCDDIMWLGKGLIIPSPQGKQEGLDFPKPLYYFSTALCQSGLSEEKVHELLKCLAELELAKLHLPKEELKRDPQVLSKRRSFYEAFGKGGAMSPTKRMSLVEPDTEGLVYFAKK